MYLRRSAPVSAPRTKSFRREPGATGQNSCQPEGLQPESAMTALLVLAIERLLPLPGALPSPILAATHTCFVMLGTLSFPSLCPMRTTILFAVAITTFTGVVLSAPVVAQAFPAKPVRIVVPFPPGGPADVLGRMLGQKLAERWSQSVVIDNRGGAAGNIGAEFVAKSAADGYTLLLNATSHVVNASMYSKLAFDPIKDFTPVTEVASYM